MVTCKERALKWVHAYSAGGALTTTVPIPGGAAVALGAIETHLIYWIAKIYGEELTMKEIMVVAAGLEAAGFVLKGVAMEVVNFIPVFGQLAKAGIAVGAIQGIGRLIVDHYEDKYPGKLYSVNPAIESSVK